MKNTSGPSALSPLCARAARALVLNREARLNFPGIFMNLTGHNVGDDGITLEMKDDPTFRNAQGELNWLALGVLVDVALGAVMRGKAGPTMRPATVQLQMQMTGASTRGDVATHAKFVSFSEGSGLRQALTIATIEAGGALIGHASGAFAMFELPPGSTQKAEPWLPQELANAPLGDVDLDKEEMEAVKLCWRAERAATDAHPFVDHFWSGLPKAGAGKSRLAVKVTPHLGNRIGHVHGGVLLGLAARVASAALPESMRLSNISSWFVSPGQGPRLTVRSRVVQQGRSLAVVRTQIVGASGRLVLEATSQHAATD
jgi:acyl-coenzyme A thioesterase PaaI-like protein